MVGRPVPQRHCFKTPFPGIIHSLARYFMPWIGGFSLRTILGQPSATVYLDLQPYSAETVSTEILYPKPDETPGGLAKGLSRVEKNDIYY